MNDEQPVKPAITEELAQPDSLAGVAFSIRQNAQTFVEMLVPSDTVLAQRGNGKNYDIYREVLRDDQCKSCYQQRVESLVQAPWEVKAASESAEDEAIAEWFREMLNSLEFDRITQKMHYGIWYGHAVGECMWELREGKVWLKDVRVRDRGRFRYDRLQRLHLYRSNAPIELMPERKFWTFNTGADHDDEPYGLGLGHYAYWPVFFKRNGIKFWLVFQEKFAAPTIMGKASGGQFGDEVLRAKILAELRRFASDTAILVPEGVEVTLLEAARSGASSYEELNRVMDAALAKIILSQTMTTDNGSSRSQAEVHEGVKDDVIKSDGDLICSSLNNGPIKWLTEWNFPGAKPPRVYRNLEPAEDLNKRAERDAKVYTLGYEPTEEYIRETYGEGWQKRAMEAGLDPKDVASAAASEFAELGAIAAAKGARRMDQTELVEAARRFANRHKSIVGKRVKQLVDFAESSGDYATMRKHLTEMMAEVAPAEIQAPIERSGIMARLLGMFRAQR